MPNANVTELPCGPDERRLLRRRHALLVAVLVGAEVALAAFFLAGAGGIVGRALGLALLGGAAWTLVEAWRTHRQL